MEVTATHDHSELEAEWMLLWASWQTNMNLACHKSCAHRKASEVLEALARRRGPFKKLGHFLKMARSAPNSVPASVILRSDSRMPKVVRELSCAPFGLHIAGDLSLLDKKRSGWLSAGIVGSRRPTRETIVLAKKTAQALAAQGVCLVSGMAMGVDATAHVAGVNATGGTIAVLGCGTSVVYPRRNQKIFDQLREGNAVLISEYAPHATARKEWFPQRNRLIAALSDALIVMQAGERSGSLQTANHALDLGLPVGVMIGGISQAEHAGGVRLIQDGATVIASPGCALRMLGIRAVPRPAQHEFGSIMETPRTVTQIATLGGLPVGDVQIRLVELEIEGFIRRTADGQYVNCD